MSNHNASSGFKSPARCNDREVWTARDVEDLEVGYHCGSCKRRYHARDPADTCEDGTLRCPDCGNVGTFIVHANELVDRVNGYDAIAQRGFTQVPRALTDHAAAIGLKPAEAWMLVELDSLRFCAHEPLELTYEAIGKRIGLDKSNARKWLVKMRTKGFIAWVSGSTKHEPNRYSLEPLWAKLNLFLTDPAILPKGPTSAKRPNRAGGRAESPSTSRAESPTSSRAEAPTVSKDDVESFFLHGPSVHADRPKALTGARSVAPIPEQPRAPETLGPVPDDDAGNDIVGQRCLECGGTERMMHSPDGRCFGCRFAERQREWEAKRQARLEGRVA